jgi:hypothetical protein
VRGPHVGLSLDARACVSLTHGAGLPGLSSSWNHARNEIGALLDRVASSSGVGWWDRLASPALCLPEIFLDCGASPGLLLKICAPLNQGPDFVAAARFVIADRTGAQLRIPPARLQPRAYKA